jgi:hypothetical protein
VFESRVLRRMFDLKREEVAGENCIMRSFITFIIVVVVVVVIVIIIIIIIIIIYLFIYSSLAPHGS